MQKRYSTPPAHFLIALAALLFLLSGCFHTPSQDTAIDNGHEQARGEGAAQFEPYYPADFEDLLIPGELVWNREKSVSLNTDSFKGGILNFTGRVEVTSLMEFFANSMKNDGWTAVGSMKAKDVLLAYTRGNNSCMIKITDGGPIGKTEVYVYIAKSNL